MSLRTPAALAATPPDTFKRERCRSSHRVLWAVNLLAGAVGPRCVRKKALHAIAAGERTHKTPAERIGVSRQTIGAIEAGNHSPSLQVVLRISRAPGKGSMKSLNASRASGEFVAGQGSRPRSAGAGRGGSKNPPSRTTRWFVKQSAGDGVTESRSKRCRLVAVRVPAGRITGESVSSGADDELTKSCECHDRPTPQLLRLCVEALADGGLPRRGREPTAPARVKLMA